MWWLRGFWRVFDRFWCHRRTKCFARNFWRNSSETFFLPGSVAKVAARIFMPHSFTAIVTNIGVCGRVYQWLGWSPREARDLVPKYLYMPFLREKGNWYLCIMQWSCVIQDAPCDEKWGCQSPCKDPTRIDCHWQCSSAASIAKITWKYSTVQVQAYYNT